MQYIDSIEEKGESCQGCGASVIEPYIKCAVCVDKLILCLHCFARGVEIGVHENNHSYEVIKDDFTVLERGWTAGEETRLLNAVFECGFGNWTDIANQVKSKTAKQCELHYVKCFINRPCTALPVLEESNILVHPTPIVFRPSEDPPRPSEGSSLQQEMSGYMAARGDFTVEHDNYAELDLNNIEVDQHQSDVERDVMLAVLHVYRDVLHERERRKNIVKKYGLINFRRQHCKERRYYQTIGYHRMEKLRCFMKVMAALEWDMYLESLHYEYELRHTIRELQEYRENGIVKLASSEVYDRLKSRRTEDCMRRPVFDDVCATIQDDKACRQWLHKESKLGNIVKGMASSLPNLARKSAPPLDVSGLPNYEKLNGQERELCANVRIVPDAYIQYKKILLNEQSKTGYVRLGTARNLLKIDVNKTRKVFDFLCKEGSICKELGRNYTLNR